MFSTTDEEEESWTTQHADLDTLSNTVIQTKWYLHTSSVFSLKVVVNQGHNKQNFKCLPLSGRTRLKLLLNFTADL